MELPHIGQHCSEPNCKQLDFLPMKCDACSKVFCSSHLVYALHNCTESYRKDNQVPVCPLCNLPCPVKKGESPDVVVERHIESDCQSDPAKARRKVYTNKCSKKGCKQKELIPVKCETCHLNYCLRHRHEQDHECKGFQGSGRPVNAAGAAAIFRSQKPAAAKPTTSSTSRQTNRNSNNVRSSGSSLANSAAFQGSMNEDEALARALAMSMNSSPNPASVPQGLTDQEREDFLLAQALAMSEQEASSGNRNPQRPRTADRCAVQ